MLVSVNEIRLHAAQKATGKQKARGKLSNEIIVFFFFLKFWDGHSSSSLNDAITVSAQTGNKELPRINEAPKLN